MWKRTSQRTTSLSGFQIFYIYSIHLFPARYLDLIRGHGLGGCVHVLGWRVLGGYQTTSSYVHPLNMLARSSSSTTLRITRPSPLRGCIERAIRPKVLGASKVDFEGLSIMLKSLFSVLKCFASGKGALYDELSTERIRELTMQFQKGTQITPTLSTYIKLLLLRAL